MNRFKQAYAEALKQAVAEHPEEYWWTETNVIHGNTGDTVIPAESVDVVIQRMFKAMDNGSYNKDGRAFRMACKKLGIAHSYKAINAVLAEAENVD